VHYVPLDLEKESEEFISSLGFLSKPFTFQRRQLPLFLSQIYEKLAVPAESGEDGDEDGHQMDEDE
jgi:hypothetical protein